MLLKYDLDTHTETVGKKTNQRKSQITVSRKRIYCFHKLNSYIRSQIFGDVIVNFFTYKWLCHLPGILVFFPFWLKGNASLFLYLYVSIFHFWLDSGCITRRWRIKLGLGVGYIGLYFILSVSFSKRNHQDPKIEIIWKLMTVCLFIKSFFIYQTFSYFYKEHLKAWEKELDNFC